MMIERNASGVFNGRVMGMEPGDGYQPEDIEEVTYDGKQRRLLQAIQPINFNEKIMGGQRAEMFLNGKLPSIGGSLDYTQRVNMLTGKGARMEEQNNMKTMESTSNAADKIASMLGGQTGAKFDINKILGSTKKSNMLSGHTGKSDNFNNLLGNKKHSFENILGSSSKKSSDVLGYGNINASDKIAKMLTGKTKSKPFDMKTGFGNRVFIGLNLNKKINEGFGIGLTNIKNNNIKAKNNAMQKINSSFGMGINMAKSNVKPNNFNVQKMFGTFGNPEKTARTRIKQQNGLPMFGDFDGDKVLNMFDCNPLNPMLQGEQHDLVKYAGGKGTDIATIGSKEIVPTNSKNIEVLEAKRVEVFGPDELKFGQGTHNTHPDSFIDGGRMGNTFIPGDSFGDNTGGTGGIGGTPDIEPDISIPDMNRDGIIDNKDNIIFNGLDLNARIKFAQDGFNTAKSGDKKKYGDLLVNLMKQGPSSTESEKTRRAESKEAWDREKYDIERADRIKSAQQKKSLGEKSLAFEKEKFVGSLSLQQKQLGMQKQKGDLAMWETKLRAGENMLGTLIGGGKPADFGAKVGSGGTNLARDPRGLIGGGSGGNIMMPSHLTGSMGASEFQMMNMIGVRQEPFGSKVMATVGASQPKSFAQTVGETIGTKKPEELIREEQVKREALIEESVVQPQQFRQPVQQYQQPIRPAQTMQQFRQPVQQYQQPMVQQQRKVDWDNVSPQQAAQVDTSYAKYMAESQGEHVYRRGPYKKRQYR